MTTHTITDADRKRLQEYYIDDELSGERLLLKHFAAHRTTAVAKREAEIVAVIRDLHTYANEAIDPKDLLRMIELIQTGDGGA